MESLAVGLKFPFITDVVDIFKNLNKIPRVIITPPMICSCVKRLLSTAGAMKCVLRMSMNTTPFNNMVLLSFERELCHSLNYDEIISVFNAKCRLLRLVLQAMKTAKVGLLITHYSMLLSAHAVARPLC